MRNIFMTFILITALLVTSTGPVLAQEGPHIYTPYLSGAGPLTQGSSTDEQLFLPQFSSQHAGLPEISSSERGGNGNHNGWGNNKHGRVTPQERAEAAARALQQGKLNPLMVQGQTMSIAAAATDLAGAVPHYFSHPNYANSPLPTLEGTPTYFGNALQDRTYASDYPVAVGEWAPVLVVLTDALPEGFLTSFETWNQANSGSSQFPSAGNIFHAYVLRPTANANEYTVVFDSGELTVPALSVSGVSEVASFGVANLAVQTGDMLAFYGQGIPVDVGGGADILSYQAPAPPLQDSAITLGSAEFPIYSQNRTYSFGANVVDMTNLSLTGGIRKFVDGLPGLGAANANERGQYIPIATPDTTTYPGADYYEIELVEYTEQMHSDLPLTTLRGYRQVNMGGTPPHYLGPTIVATKDRPVRIKFTNSLPSGEGGNLFIPVDSTVMGSGLTATGHEWEMANQQLVDPQNPLCNDVDKFTGGLVSDGRCYPDNRATIHLHGGISPWISDGTPHQWITPANEDTPYPEGASVKAVPDMGGCDASDDGCMTLYYTNQQSARLTFYHDHAWGITRLNVYAGMAAPYVITDDTEATLVSEGLIPGPTDAETIPLVIQDKTFVPNDAQLAVQDETWDTANWGGEGSLWVPHVYSPAQNPGDASGVNEYGRWAYGPWFWPPTNDVTYPPIDNAYYDPACDPDIQWCEPPQMPSTPYISMGMESFNDTPVINGAAYPTLSVDPKAYRFRILNAANDRFFNLSLYKAVDANGVACDLDNPNPTPESTGIACTEVALNPDEVAAALLDPAGVFPTPGPDVNNVETEGPDWIDIASEGGFLPAPAVVPAQPTTWVVDPTVFNAGNVDLHSLLIGPAERHDVIVDFSAFAGQTLILYNDAPAAFPARDPRYDYYTGNPDLRDTGGAPSTLPGYGPNTRTMMQIVVANSAPAAYDLAALQNAFKSTSQGGMGVFESGQNPIIVGQSEYNSAYGTSFTGNDGLVQIHDTSLTFETLLSKGDPTVEPLSMNLKPKMIQDEMGEAFELEYGRMSGFLGVETPNAQAGQQNMILHPYTYPPDEIIDGVERSELGLLPGVDITPIASADDGTQIWKITHNGVDTHPIHWHLYDVQLVNRVGWDGIIRKPDPTELGWKDTIRISPLEDTIVAIRPIIPDLPAPADPTDPSDPFAAWAGGIPNSIRLLDPALPEGAYLHGANTTLREANNQPLLAFNPDGEPVDIINHYINFGWEYVYHCHILSHEEMDMMHAQVVGVAPAAPGTVSAVRTGNGSNQTYELTWMDNSKNETGFVIERRVAGSIAAWTTLGTLNWSLSPSDPTYPNGPGTGQISYSDPIGNSKDLYEYQVYAINVVGDTWDYSNPAFNQIPPGGGWPTLTLDSRGGNGPESGIQAPTSLTASAVVKNKNSATVMLSWNYNTGNEAGFIVQRAYDAAFTSGVVEKTAAAGSTSFSDTVARGTTFYFRVLAFSDTSQSSWSQTASVATP